MNHQTVTTKQIRDNLADIVDQVAVAGKSFVITKFGKKRAMIVPIQAEQANLAISRFQDAVQQTFGSWKEPQTLSNKKNEHKKIAIKQVQAIRKPRHEIFS